jgi:uncharacterized protein (TIGR00255 family)
MQSMTGFGASRVSSKKLNVEVSVRSVNGRYLEPRLHLPKRHVAIEQEALKMCKSFFSRGTVDLYIHVSSVKTKSGSTFNVEMAKAWLTDARQALKEIGLADTLSARDILNIPDFVHKVEETPADTAENTLVLRAIKEALKKCADEREREGASLQKVCLGYMSDFKKMLKGLSASREIFKKEAFDKLHDRLKKVLESSKLEFDSSRVLQEVAHLVEKTDVEEELQRFSEHVLNVEKLLKSKESHGKKLDFYAQELLREVNTIGSKSQYAIITETVIALKSKIEQFREQVQNIE